jgi:ribonuclease Z
LEHRVTAYGYRVEEKDRLGHFDAEKARSLGIPFGPLYGELKRGKTITLPDGRQISGKELVGPDRVGRKIAYCTDTIFCEGSIELAKDADVVIHEATFAHQDAQMAYERLHSTSTMAAQVALAANAKTLIMTHFSPRYAPGNELNIKDLLQEAKAIFANTEIAEDFLTYPVPPRAANPKSNSPMI